MTYWHCWRPIDASLLCTAQTGKQKSCLASSSFQSDTNRCFGRQQIKSFDAIVFIGERGLRESIRIKSAICSNVPLYLRYMTMALALGSYFLVSHV